MTNPSTPPESPKSGQKMKGLLLQGLIGAASLTGATAIPIMVQRALSPTPAPIAAPTATPTVPATAPSSVPVSSPVAPTAVQPSPMESLPQVQQDAALKDLTPIANPEQDLNSEDEDRGKGHGKKKGHKD